MLSSTVASLSTSAGRPETRYVSLLQKGERVLYGRYGKRLEKGDDGYEETGQGNAASDPADRARSQKEQKRRVSGDKRAPTEGYVWQESHRRLWVAGEYVDLDHSTDICSASVTVQPYGG